MTVLWNILVVILTVLAMEFVARYAHEHVMHGWGWTWHKSHHQSNSGTTFERNDLYAVIFAVPSFLMIYLGAINNHWILWPGVGMTIYGILYFIVHDGLVHNRWPLKILPRIGYLKRIVQAHRLHHAVRTRTGCVSFGFLYAPSIDKLKSELKQRVHDEVVF